VKRLSLFARSALNATQLGDYSPAKRGSIVPPPEQHLYEKVRRLSFPCLRALGSRSPPDQPDSSSSYLPVDSAVIFKMAARTSSRDEGRTMVLSSKAARAEMGNAAQWKNVCSLECRITP
jgi:hypothetical protein